jgi:hypothetical protein
MASEQPVRGLKNRTGGRTRRSLRGDRLVKRLLWRHKRAEGRLRTCCLNICGGARLVWCHALTVFKPLDPGERLIANPPDLFQHLDLSYSRPFYPTSTLRRLLLCRFFSSWSCLVSSHFDLFKLVRNPGLRAVV